MRFFGRSQKFFLQKQFPNFSIPTNEQNNSWNYMLKEFAAASEQEELLNAKKLSEFKAAVVPLDTPREVTQFKLSNKARRKNWSKIILI